MSDQLAPRKAPCLDDGRCYGVRPWWRKRRVGALSGVPRRVRKEGCDVFGLRRWPWTGALALDVPHFKKNYSKPRSGSWAKGSRAVSFEWVLEPVPADPERLD